MLSSSARHARRRSARAGRSAVALTVAVAAGLPVALTSVATSAGAADACLTPQVRDVMVSQGLPSYAKLTSGKTTLVKYFLSAPSCAPTGSSIQITGGSLSLSTGGGALPLSALLPLPPVGPASAAPVPSAESDPLFVVPGSRLSAPLVSTTVTFSADLEFVSRTASGATQSGQLTVSKLPSGQNVQAVVERRSNPLRVGVFAMGDAGTAVAPTSYASQFPAAAEAALQAGMESVHRVLPLADGVGDVTDTSSGLRWSLGAGMINLGAHPDPYDGQIVSWTGAGQPYCGRATHFDYISKELATARTNWNSVNPTAKIDLAYGAVHESISLGPTTGGSDTCVEGYSTVGGTTSWGRVIGATDARAGITGSIATMELLHNTGSVAKGTPRYDGGFHSLNQQADVTAPERAWNTKGARWVAHDRSAMQYQTAGWTDATSLLEKEDWDTLQCQLTPAPLLGTTSCAKPGSIGTAAASAQAGSAFFLSGITDGTAAGTRAHTYLDDDVNYEAPDPTSDYRFVQRDALGGIVRVDGFGVHGTASHHDGQGSGPGQAHSHNGTFGTEFPAESATTRIQLYKGDPTSPGAVLLHQRDRNAPPQHVSVSVQGRTATVAVADENPADVRLDVFYRCPDVTSPLANALQPTVAGPLAVFAASFDTSLGCDGGTLVFRASDGYLVSSRDGLLDGLTTHVGSAAIYAPGPGGEVTAGRNLALSGSGRDAAGREADELVWTLSGPSYPQPTEVARGPVGTVVPPAGGFVPGRHTVRLDALDASGALLATASTELVVLADRDRDGMPDAHERKQICFAPAAEDDPRNAPVDSDLDGQANVVDAAPCVTTSNVGVETTPTSLLTSSSGSPVTVELSDSPVDLRTLSTRDFVIRQIAGHPTDFRAYARDVHDASSATLKFDRKQINAFLLDKGIDGFSPFFVGTTSGSLRGVDASAPNVFP